MSAPSPQLGMFAGAGLSVLLHGVAAAAIGYYGLGHSGIGEPDMRPLSVSLIVEEPAIVAAPADIPAPTLQAPRAPIPAPAAAQSAPAPAPTLTPAPSPPMRPQAVARPSVPKADVIAALPEAKAAPLSAVETPAPASQAQDDTPGESLAALPAATSGSSGAAETAAGSGIVVPRLVHAPPPEYPALARRRGQQGRVLLLVEVNSEGVPVEARILGKSGYDSLDEAALKTVKDWRFDASAAQRRAVEVPIVFRLGS